MPPQHCMVGSTSFLSKQMQEHCYLEHMASALTSQLNCCRSTLSCSVIVVVYFVCAHLHSSNYVHYLLWWCVQSMFSIIAVYVFLCLHISNKKYNIIIIIASHLWSRPMVVEVLQQWQPFLRSLVAFPPS